MTGGNDKGAGGFSGLNNLVTSLEEAVQGEEAFAERVAQGESRQGDVASEAKKSDRGIKSLIPKSFFTRTVFVLAFVTVISSVWWWPLARNMQEDWRIQSSIGQLEAFDRKLWEKSKQGTDPRWTIRFAEKLLYGQSDKNLKEIGIFLLQRMARSDSFQAAKGLADYYADAKDGTVDHEEATKWKNVSLNLVRDQAKRGLVPAMWALAEMHAKGEDVELNVKLASELYIAAAEKDPAEFGEKLAGFFRRGSNGFDQSYSDAFAWYKKAASAGNSETKGLVAMYIAGLEWRARERGVSPQEIESWRSAAARIYQDAAHAGDPWSMYKVADGILSENPRYLGNVESGTDWLKKAAAADEPNAIVLMALMSVDAKTPIPSNVENLLLRAWKLKTSEQETDNSRFIEDVWSDVLVKLGIFNADGNKLIGSHDPVRFYGWLNAHADLNSESRNYRFASQSEIKLADQLTTQILSIARSKNFPNEWPQLPVEAPRKFVPFDGELDKVATPKPSNGYLKGEKQSLNGGLSSFTIDNTTGSDDAEVRLYLNGAQVRSMFVRIGTKFTAEKLSPGTYKMRYKITSNGKKKVYEAKEQFVLAETKTEDGTRFSRMTVTLFTVKDGNMQTEEVPLDKF